MASASADEPVAAPRQRLDVSRLVGVVAAAPAERLDAGGERRVGDRGPVPYGAEEFFLGDHLAGAFGEEGGQRQRFDGNRTSRAPDIVRGVDPDASLRT